MAAMPLQRVESQIEQQAEEESVKKWAVPSSTVVNKLKLLSLCDPSLTLADVDESLDVGKPNDSVMSDLKRVAKPKPIQPRPLPVIGAPTKTPTLGNINKGNSDSQSKTSLTSNEQQNTVAKKGTVVLGDKSVAAMKSTPEIVSPALPPKPVGLAAKFANLVAKQKGTFVISKQDEAKSTNQSSPAVSPSKKLNAFTPTDDVSPVQLPKHSELSPPNSPSRDPPKPEVAKQASPDSTVKVEEPSKTLLPNASTSSEEPCNENLSKSGSPLKSIPRDNFPVLQRSTSPKLSQSLELSPKKAQKTLFATANDEMVLKITLGHFDSPNPKLLRTCSMPDLMKTCKAEDDEDEPQSRRRNSVVEASDLFPNDSESSDHDSDQSHSHEYSPNENEPIKKVGNEDDEPMKEAENEDNETIKDAGLEDEDVDEDDDTTSMIANLQSVLMNSTMTSDDDWDGDDESESDTNTSDVSDTESVFSRNEAIREELERELGTEDFTEAYRHIQEMHEDENEDMNHAEEKIRNILGKKYDGAHYDKIFKLVMADNAYCEDNN